MVKHADNKPVEKMAKAKRSRKKQQCVDCDQEFNRRIDLQQHRRDEHIQKKNACPVCKKTFDTPKRLKMHSQFHNAGGEFECFYCQKQFNKAWKMKIHLVNHSGRPSFVCQICGDDFLYPGKIVTHLKRIHDVWWACKDCGEVCYDYDTHLCKIYGCKDCLKCFASKTELAVHVKIHTIKSDKSDDITPIDLTEPASPPSPQPALNLSQPVLNLNQAVLNLNQAQPLVKGDNLPQVQGPKDIQSANPKRKVVVKFLNFGTREHTKSGVVKESVKCANMTLSSEEVEKEDTKQDLNLDLIVPNCVDEEHDTNAVGDNVEIKVENIKIEAIKQEDISSDCSSSFDVPVEHNCHESNSSAVSSESTNPSINSWDKFKVPEATINKWRKYEKSVQKSFRRKKDMNQFSKSREKLLSKLQLFDNSNTNLSQQDKVSFESWLSSEGFSNPNHDFVFGCETGSGGKNQEKEPHCQDFNRRVPKKEEMDMTFEDLCQF